MQYDTPNSQLYFQPGDCFLCQTFLPSPPPPPPPPPLTSCYLLCKIKRNIASKLSLIQGLCFQIQEYEKEIRQLRTDYANCSYEVGIFQSGHTSTNQVYPTSETLATIVTTFGDAALVMIGCWYSWQPLTNHTQIIPEIVAPKAYTRINVDKHCFCHSNLEQVKQKKLLFREPVSY